MEERCKKIIGEVSKAITGKDDVIRSVLTAIIAGGHVLLEDVPGVGKTTLALSFSKALGLDYKRMQCTSDTLPSDIIGFSLYNKDKDEFIYKPGPIITNIFLADELNRTSSKTQSALLEAMEEGQISVDGRTYKLPEPFIVIATQNPASSAGTMLLPDSQLDRFMVKLSMGYPSFDAQVELLSSRHDKNPIDYIERVVSEDQLLAIKEEVKAIYIDKSIYEYATRLSESTRNDEDVIVGVSPRGVLAMCNYAKAQAFLEGRNYVIPEDLQKVFKETCAHRLILSRKTKISGITAQEICDKVLEREPLPAINER